MTRSELLLIGGRSGVGKTSVSLEIHAQLTGADVKHAVIDGDNLDLAHPAPWEHGLAERNLASMWSNYRALGYRRLIYTNTVSVRQCGRLTAAMGDGPKVTAILLTSSDERRRSGWPAGRLAALWRCMLTAASVLHATWRRAHLPGFTGLPPTAAPLRSWQAQSSD